MANLVTSVGIPDLVTKLREGEYLVPQFQREFVWSTADVIALLTSIIDARPIGMITLWEQEDNSGLELEHISLPDSAAGDDDAVVYFGRNGAKPNKYFAILDGRQRSTAISMAFGGLRPRDARRKHAGQFYLNVAAREPVDRIVFKKGTDIEKESLDVLANCISQGLFPFKLDDGAFEDIKKQWMAYIRAIRNPDFYKNGELPDEEELRTRETSLDNAFNGIIDTTLAVYSVPKKYDLGTICEIFETLNTTGTRVSTVDLIHSWLYADTRVGGGQEPLFLRDWIRDLGQREGAVGWSNPEDRPELIAQFVTAAYLAEKHPAPPRKIGGRQEPVSSVKSGDLLATPSRHWLNVTARRDEFAGYIGDFQRAAAGAYFPMRACPYPILGAIYVGLRWANAVDGRGWKVDDIGMLFRAFFWRNVLMGRYDQGFLTKMSADLKLLAQLLDDRPIFDNFGSWAAECNSTLEREVAPRPSREEIVSDLLDPRPTGALSKAVALPLVTRPIRDMLDPGKPIGFGKAAEDIELHHIFPKAWIRDNVKKEELERYAENGEGGPNCAANLTPMLRVSNNIWRAKLPGNALADMNVSLETHGDVLRSHYIGHETYDDLVADNKRMLEFWRGRANAIAADLFEKTLVSG